MLFLLAMLTASATTQSIERVSVGSDEKESEAPCLWPSVSADGRFVAFGSAARNLVPGKKERHFDVFVRDRELGTTEAASLGPGSEPGNHDSYMPSLSGDGRVVAFVSVASNLVPKDTPDTWDVFVRDRKKNLTQCVSLNLAGAPGTGPAGYPVVSADGRYVAFQSEAQDLVLDCKAGCSQVYVRDLANQKTECVSVVPSGAVGKTWSAWPSLSADGRYVAFVGTDGLDGGSPFAPGHVFVRDRRDKKTVRASLASNEAQADAACDWGSISGDGRFVAFSSTAANLGAASGTHPNIFLRDMVGGTTTWVSRGVKGAAPDGTSSMPYVSADGRYVSFTSWASNLVPGDTGGFADVFRWDRTRRETRAMSRGNGSSRAFGLSSEGRVVFESESSDLVEGDTNGAADIFLASP